jgi:hypothetical protein
MCSCSKAFVSIRPCAIIVVGVAGSMPVHGIGTALFLVSVGDKQVITSLARDASRTSHSQFIAGLGKCYGALNLR